MCETNIVEYWNPFLEFPEEIWDKILEAVDDTDDILKVFEVFPQLRNLVKRNQFSWLFGEILPHIFPKLLEVWDILECRLVSRRWNNAVNTCLLKHPDRSPYKTSTDAIVQETHMNFRRLPCVTSSFCQSYLVEDFMQAYNGQNPFPGRHVSITDGAGYWNYANRNQPDTEPFDTTGEAYGVSLANVAEMLKIAGHHIWHIAFYFDYLAYVKNDVLFSQVLKPLFECLSYLPNLKSLRFTDFNFEADALSEGDRQRFSNLVANTRFPFRLESMYISYDRLDWKGKGITKDVMKLFVNHDGVKRFVLLADYKTECYREVFPNLTDLCVFASSQEELDFILKDLKCSSVRKLKVHTHNISVVEILNVIKAYQIESLHIFGISYGKQGESVTKILPEGDSPTDKQKAGLSAVQDLQLQPAPGLDFSFLKMLPNLQHIYLKLHGQVWEGMYRADANISADDLFRKSLHNFKEKVDNFPRNFSSIWKELPKLRMLTIKQVFPLFENANYFQYARECPNSYFFNRCPLNDVYDEKDYDH